MLVREKLDGLIDVRNPLDLTPMANDAAHEDAVRSFLGDENVDLVLCSTIPLTPAMATLSTGVPEEQSIRNPGSLVNRLARIIQEAKKPVVVSLDSGAIYDPMCQAFEEMGIPTFRSVDDTIRSMGLYLEMRLRSTKCQ
jgi:acyl-CoA synthetase (NDP forming)